MFESGEASWLFAFSALLCLRQHDHAVSSKRDRIDHCVQFLQLRSFTHFTPHQAIYCQTQPPTSFYSPSSSLPQTPFLSKRLCRTVINLSSRPNLTLTPKKRSALPCPSSIIPPTPVLQSSQNANTRPTPAPCAAVPKQLA
ncbi:hypothetical protein K491DRAFT_401155 [Lophiostoma macrostomum CBS 122681]|uniref:Uncharacterized protein n=1 Tax=Lophiostoma macrostomum CBS 122681 TaxID=1314788 RepID=A0A6A6T8F4_9PLEO|nr:hypothetical protein K491DRAFT_401155 [Lophiostoma macrostomum CBS 122681]